MSTVAELRDRAAQDLGVLRLGQTLQAQDATRISQAYDEVYETLSRSGYATWAKAGEIPDEMTMHVSALVADNCLLTYSVPETRYNRIKVAAQIAMREIMRHAAEHYESVDEPEDF